MGKSKYTDTQLLALSEEHLPYEMAMLIWTVLELHAEVPPPPGNIKNALVQAFGIHARTLLKFFYDEAGSDDAIADHFLPDEISWRDVCPAMPEVLAEVNRRVNKEIVHLTYSRLSLSEETRGWRTGAIVHGFLPVMELFCSVASTTRLHSSCTEFVRDWSRKLKEITVPPANPAKAANLGTEPLRPNDINDQTPFRLP